MAGAAAGCAAGSDVSEGIDVASTTCVASFAIFLLAISPYDFQPTAARPMQTANNNVMKARAARLAIGLRSSEPATALAEVGRNVVSTGGAVGLAVKSDPALVLLSER